MKLSFHGGAREVTGACYLLETAQAKILVDCGLFQGSDECTDLNFEPFRFSPASIGLVLVTHAHLDHVGRIPKLVKQGFSGKIYSTAPTRDLAYLILEDALSLAERTGNPLYTQSDIEKVFSLWEVLPYRQEMAFKDLEFKFRGAGHILGSSLIEIWAESKHLLFTGDLGNAPSVLLPPPEKFKDIEYLIIESTYGNRTHEPPAERILNLERAVEDIAAKKGTLLIPAFATERTQDLLFLLNEMLLFRRIPEMPMFVDSPLAIRITEVFEKYVKEFSEDIKELFLKHPSLFRFRKLHFTLSVEESKKINDILSPKVVIAGSGMMNGGRILHHARRYLQDPNSILLITGHQAAGSLGRRLLDGEEMVKIFGEEVFVRAEVRKINGFSAHADNPQLFSLVEANRDTLKQVFVVQGEEAQALHLGQEIKDRLGIATQAPMLYDSFEL